MSEKSKNKLPATFTESEVGTLIEHFDSKLDLAVKGLQALDVKIDKNYAESKEFRSEVSYKFDIALYELHLIHNDLKEKVGRDEFVLLEKRVAALEKSNRK